jgi:hypothetical protein
MESPRPDGQPTSKHHLMENKRASDQGKRKKALTESKSMEGAGSLSVMKTTRPEAEWVLAMRASRQGAEVKVGLNRASSAAKHDVSVGPQITEAEEFQRGEDLAKINAEAEELQWEDDLAKVNEDYKDIIDSGSKIDALPRRQPRSRSMDGKGSDSGLPDLASNPQATTNEKLKCSVAAIAAIDVATTEGLAARSGPRPMMPQRSLRKTKSVSGDVSSGVPLLKPSSRDNLGSSSSTSRRRLKSVRGADKGPCVPNTSTATKSRIRQRCSRSPIRTRRRLSQLVDASSSCEIHLRSRSMSPGSRRTIPSAPHHGRMRRGSLCTSQRSDSVRLVSLRRGSMSASQNVGSLRRSVISKSERNGSIRRGLLTRSQQSDSTRSGSLSKSQQRTSLRTSNDKSSSRSPNRERSDGEPEYEKQREEKTSWAKGRLKGELPDADTDAAHTPEPTRWACTCGNTNEGQHNFCGMCANPKLWHCVACNYDNKCKFKFCGMCGTLKPSRRAESENVPDLAPGKHVAAAVTT